IPAELPQNLSAGAARRREFLCIRCDRDTPKFAGAFRKRLEHCYTFGAERQPEGRVLDVASREYSPVLIFESCADFEIRERRMRIFARADGVRDESAGGHAPPVISGQVAEQLPSAAP